MIYNFQLHRISLILIVALLGVGGGLLFFSGLLVGVSWQLAPGAVTTTAAAEGPGAALDGPDAPLAQVQLPADLRAPAAPAYSAPAYSAPTVTAPAFKAPTLTAPAPTVTAPAVTPPTYRPPAFQAPAYPGPSPATMPAPLSPDAVTIPGREPAADLVATAGEPAAPSPAPAAPAGALRGLKNETPQDGFALQVGAFSQSENTQKLIAELAARGFEPYVVRTATRTSQQIESVRLGHFGSRSEAAAAQTELARAEGIRAFVVRASGFVP